MSTFSDTCKVCYWLSTVALTISACELYTSELIQSTEVCVSILLAYALSLSAYWCTIQAARKCYQLQCTAPVLATPSTGWTQWCSEVVWGHTQRCQNWTVITAKYNHIIYHHFLSEALHNVSVQCRSLHSWIWASKWRVHCPDPPPTEWSVTLNEWGIYLVILEDHTTTHQWQSQRFIGKTHYLAKLLI